MRNGDDQPKLRFSQRRIRERLGPRTVICEVSDRWLQFPQDSTVLADGEHYMTVAVMTARGGVLGDGPRRKLCELCISKEAILAALMRVEEIGQDCKIG